MARRWALTLLDTVLQRLRMEDEQAGRGETVRVGQDGQRRQGKRHAAHRREQHRPAPGAQPVAEVGERDGEEDAGERDGAELQEEGLLVEGDTPSQMPEQRSEREQNEGAERDLPGEMAPGCGLGLGGCRGRGHEVGSQREASRAGGAVDWRTFLRRMNSVSTRAT